MSEMQYASILKGKVGIITGASKGIGAGVAEIFADAGVSLALVARPSEELFALEQKLSDSGARVKAFPADLRNVDQIRACVDEIAAFWGRIDFLFNNAGMGNPIPALDITEKDWDEMMDLNAKGMFFFSQAVGQYMKKQGGGKIVHMSSQASVVAIPGETVYCASKGAVNQMTKVLAVEWAKYNINVNAIGPTFTYTPGTAERLDNPEFLQGVLDKIPLKRVAKMSDIAGAVAFLVSSAADMITGELVLIDGGWTLQ